MEKLKQKIIRMLKRKGAFWSYKMKDGDDLPDDIVIEKGLMHLEFEDMHLLFELYGKDRVKKFWEEKLVPQGSYLRTLNWLLATVFFGIGNADEYLDKNAKE